MKHLFAHERSRSASYIIFMDEVLSALPLLLRDENSHSTGELYSNRCKNTRN